MSVEDDRAAPRRSHGRRSISLSPGARDLMAPVVPVTAWTAACMRFT